MEQAQEILKIIEKGFCINAPADITVSIIKNYCESVINHNKNKEVKNED